MRNREVSSSRHDALRLAALVLFTLPICLAAAGIGRDEADPTPSTMAVDQQRTESDRPVSAGLLALGFGLAVTAHTLKRRNS